MLIINQIRNLSNNIIGGIRKRIITSLEAEA